MYYEKTHREWNGIGGYGTRKIVSSSIFVAKEKNRRKFCKKEKCLVFDIFTILTMIVTHFKLKIFFWQNYRQVKRKKKKLKMNFDEMLY